MIDAATDRKTITKISTKQTIEGNQTRAQNHQMRTPPIPDRMESNKIVYKLHFDYSTSALAYFLKTEMLLLYVHCAGDPRRCS